MLAGFACFAAMRKTAADSGPAGPSLTEPRCHLRFTAYGLSSPKRAWRMSRPPDADDTDGLGFTK
jgi:hypothetical protein